MIMTLCKMILCLCFILILAGCGARNELAPVTELKWQPYLKYQKTHTYYAGKRFMPLRFVMILILDSLARINHLRPPYSLRVGQVINLQGIRRP